MAAIVINVAGQYDDKAISQAQKRLNDLKGSAAKAGGGVAGAFTNAGAQLSALGGSMVAFGGKMTKSVTLPIVGIGVGAAVAFDKVDTALDSVASATGATGETLAGLQDSFRTVAANSASNIDDVAVAIGELNTRLGLTGKPLESVSTAMLDLARVTGTDVATATRTVTRAMNDMGISAGDAGPFMDMLLVTSQQTGVTIDTLAEKMAKFGSPLRQVGFSAEEAAAMIGSFEKAGVNTDLVMGSLRISLGKMAKAGEKDLPAALGKGIDAIKNAATGGEAAAKAIELFGSRAGPDMAAAIREGRLEVGDLVAMLETSEGALAATTEAVEGPQEQFARLKNQAMLLGASFAEMALPIVDRVIPAVRSVISWFQNLDPNVKQTIVTVAAVAAAVGPLIMILGKLVMGIGAVSTAIGFLIANPVVLVIVGIVAAIAALVVGLKHAYENFEGFRNVVDAVWEGIQKAVAYVVDWFMSYVWPILEEVFGYIKTGLAVLWKAYTVYWGFIWSIVKKVVAWFMEYVWPTLDKVFQLVGKALPVLWNAYKTYWTMIANAVRTVVGWFMSYVWPVLSKVFGFIGTALGVLWNAYQRYWTFIWNLVKRVVSWFMDTMWPVIKTAFDNAKRGAEILWAGIRAAFDLIQSHVRKVIDNVKTVLEGIGKVVSTVVGFFDKIRQGIVDKVTAALDWLKGLGDRIKTAIGDVSRLLYNIGRSILTGLLDGMKKGWETVSGWVGNVGGWIANLKGPIQKDRKLLIPQGRAIMQGLNVGLRSGFRETQDVLGDIESGIVEAGRFASIVDRLRGAGLNSASLQEIVAAGPGAGATIGAAVLAGGSDAISEINRLEALLRGAGQAVGDVGSRSAVDRGAGGIGGTTVTLQAGAIQLTVGAGATIQDQPALEAEIRAAVETGLRDLAREIRAS